MSTSHTSTSSSALAAAQAYGKAGGCAAEPSERNPELQPDKGSPGVVEAVNGNIKALLWRRRGYSNLEFLLLKAQRLGGYKNPTRYLPESRETSLSTDSRQEPKFQS